MMHSAGIAERLAYGRPVDPVVDTTPVRVADRPMTALVGRILIGAIFAVSGVAKLVDPAGAAGYMTAVGIPHAHTLAIVAGVGEVLGAAMIIFGVLTRLGALGLFLYMIPVTLLFHNFWSFEGAEQKAQMVNFMKNLAIMGGLAALVAFGPSLFSIDKKVREPLQP